MAKLNSSYFLRKLGSNLSLISAAVTAVTVTPLFQGKGVGYCTKVPATLPATAVTLPAGTERDCKAGVLKCKEVSKSGENNLFNLKSFNSLKKDQTNLKIFKNSSFDSSFNSVQSLNINLSQLLTPIMNPLPPSQRGGSVATQSQLWLGRTATLPTTCAAVAVTGTAPSDPNINSKYLRKLDISSKNIKYPKISAILRAVRSIRLNRDEWKLIRYLKLITLPPSQL